jgi:hypothetical protein
MLTCIYCKRDSSTSRGIPHVMPEVLVQNQLTLPIGAKCDACNGYAGNKLEINMARYPAIAFAIQFLGAPGKRGRPRDEIGGIGRQRVDAEHVRVHFKGRGGSLTRSDGRLIFEGRATAPPDFDFLKFRRALHHIGLNFVAAKQGVHVALDPKYDPVRRYVKNPLPRSESWPYGQLNKKEVLRMTGVGFLEYEEAEFVGIHIFQTMFVVDLLNSGPLPDVMRILGGTVVPADAVEPPPLPVIIGGKLSQANQTEESR